MLSWGAQHQPKPGWLMRSPCSILFRDAGEPLCPGPPSLLPLSEPHFPPGHPPIAPSPAQPLCSNPSHPLKPLCSPNELTASRAPCSALPGGSCCCPPGPGSPGDTLGSADPLSPERANSISQPRAGLAQALSQRESPERSPRDLQNKGRRGWTPVQRAQLSPGSTSGSVASALVS